MRVKVKLKSTAITDKGKPSPFYYTTTVNKGARSTPAASGKANAKQQGGKLKIRKFDPVVRKHVIFEEDKIK